MQQEISRDNWEIICSEAHLVTGLPNFLYYYWAVNIRVLLYWLGNDNDDADTEWLNLEGASVNLTLLKALLCCKLPFTQPISDFTSNPVVLHSIKIWNQFRRSFSLTDLSQDTPTAKNLVCPIINR